jgi:hypothetical protein
VTAVEVVSQGSGYAPGDTLTVDNTLLAGSNTDLVFKLQPKDIATAHTFATITEGTEDDFTLSITVNGDNIKADTTCKLTLSGLLNANQIVPINGDKIKHKLISGNTATGTPYSKISDTQALVAKGVMSNDRLSLSNNLPSQTGVTLTYTLSSNRQINVNDMIEVEVPNWSSPSTVASTSICGTTTFDVEEIGTDSTSNYGLRFKF